MFHYLNLSTIYYYYELVVFYLILSKSFYVIIIFFIIGLNCKICSYHYFDLYDRYSQTMITMTVPSQTIIYHIFYIKHTEYNTYIWSESVLSSISLKYKIFLILITRRVR